MQCSVIVCFLFIVLADCTNIPAIQGRIVGGKVADIKFYPYQVSVRYKGRHFCGGCIIAPDTILTAAHCTAAIKNISALTVSTGSAWLQLGTIHEVYEFQRHPRYNPSKGLSNDVCKLKIYPSVIYSRTTQPIKLATKRPEDNTSLVVSGWGHLSENEKYTQHLLRAVTVNVINQNECRQNNRFSQITNMMICAGAKGKDSCQGDSGGPLVDTHSQELVGVVSFGKGCARAEYPGVYASVPDLLDFITA